MMKQSDNMMPLLTMACMIKDPEMLKNPVDMNRRLFEIFILGWKDLIMQCAPDCVFADINSRQDMLNQIEERLKEM